MTTCTECKHLFPDDLVSSMAISDGNGLRYQKVCPMCGLKIQNAQSGMSRRNFSPGSMAQQMLERARTFVGKLAKGD